MGVLLAALQSSSTPCSSAPAGCAHLPILAPAPWPQVHSDSPSIATLHRHVAPADYAVAKWSVRSSTAKMAVAVVPTSALPGLCPDGSASEWAALPSMVEACPACLFCSRRPPEQHRLHLCFQSTHILP